MPRLSHGVDKRLLMGFHALIDYVVAGNPSKVVIKKIVPNQ